MMPLPIHGGDPWTGTAGLDVRPEDAKSMTPEKALKCQIERYRQMTGEQRLALALELHELACEVARAGIRRQYPHAKETEVNRHLQERIRLSREP